MNLSIRLARLSDREKIAPWTADTFFWGDYVADALESWLADERGRVFVAEQDGAVVAVTRILMVSRNESWAQGIRVHPDLRRTGIGSALGEASMQWAADEGARIVRLAIEDWNDAARNQVDRLGFRPLCGWHNAVRGVGENSPVPEGNGGRRVPGPERLRPAAAAEADPALLSWATGDLARGARSLYPEWWVWQRLDRNHLIHAAQRRALWEGRPGWALADIGETTMRVHWLETAESDAGAMVRALVDRAADVGVERLSLMVPDVDWITRAVRHSGAELHGMTVFGRELRASS